MKNLEDLINVLEEKEQQTLFEWASLLEHKHVELQLLHAIPNGGYRHKATAIALKRQGVKAGVPDVFLPVSRGGSNGLYIELKRRSGGQLSDAQKKWIEALGEQGYAVHVCRGWDSARDVIVDYLGLS